MCFNFEFLYLSPQLRGIFLFILSIHNWVFYFQPEYYRDAAHFHRTGDGNEYRLEIPHAKLDFTGTYTVYAKNCHGDAKAIISLQILAKGNVF